MSDKKHIDRLFQEKLKDFEATPNDSVWENIHAQLHDKDEDNRKVIPFWWKLAGVAAILALLLTVGIKLMSNDFNSDTTIPFVDTEKKSSDKSNEASKGNFSDSEIDNAQTESSSEVANEDVISEEIFNNANKTINNNSETNKRSPNKLKTSDTNETRIVTNSNEKNRLKTSNRFYKSAQKDNLNTTKDAIANINKADENGSYENSENQNNEQFEIEHLIKDSKTNNGTTVSNASEKMEDILNEEKKDELLDDNSIEDAIAEANTEDEKDEKEKKLNRWNISPNVAPVYFNSLGKGSSLDDQFVDNTKKGEVTMSYGVGGSYAINDRLKVRAGINKVDMGYNTNNVIAFRSIDSTSSARVNISNISLNDNAQNMTFVSTENLNRNITPEIINSKADGSLNQRFGFIEVPLEVEYALINNKLGVNVIGGFSTLFVDKNEIYSVFDGTETRIGEANNINNMSYSANFGLGINYHISEKIKVNVEPTFKYQINTFNKSSGDFQPYFIGIYTGLSYKF